MMIVSIDDSLVLLQKSNTKSNSFKTKNPNMTFQSTILKAVQWWKYKKYISILPIKPLLLSLKVQE